MITAVTLNSFHGNELTIISVDNSMGGEGAGREGRGDKSKSLQVDDGSYWCELVRLRYSLNYLKSIGRLEIKYLFDV